MNKAAIIKDRVTARQAAERYGLHVDRQGWAPCPFHRETKPSLRVYEGKGGWHCFGCNAGGSVIDLVMQLEHLSFSQAVVRLDHDFQLGLGGRQTAQERREARAREKALADAKEAAERKYAQMRAAWESRFDWWFTLARLAHMLRPRSPQEDMMLYGEIMWALPIALNDVQTAWDEMMYAAKGVKELAGVYI